MNEKKFDLKLIENFIKLMIIGGDQFEIENFRKLFKSIPFWVDLKKIIIFGGMGYDWIDEQKVKRK